MIEVEGLEKTYPREGVAIPVLRGIDFRIERGEYVAIMGTSGTGKSTLMHILGCLDQPTAGRYRLAGREVSSFPDDALSRVRNEQIGFVFQQFHLLERASALRNVLLPLIYADEYPEDADERARQALAAVGLAERETHTPQQLSGGQQQRVAIARALIADPEVILADEPTGNLDRQSGLEVMGIFQTLHRQGRTIVVVTHDPAVAEHAQRIIVLEDGRVTEDRAVERRRDPDRELHALTGEEAVR